MIGILLIVRITKKEILPLPNIVLSHLKNTALPKNASLDYPANSSLSIIDTNFKGRY